VDFGEVTPAGWVGEVRAVSFLHGSDGPRVPLKDRMPRILLAAQFPNVAALRHLTLPSLLKTEILSAHISFAEEYDHDIVLRSFSVLATLSGLLLTPTLAASDESAMNPGRKQGRILRQISKTSHQKATGEKLITCSEDAIV